MRLYALGSAFVPALLLACSEPEAAPETPVTTPGVEFARSQLRIPTDSGTVTLEIEVASTDEQRAQGMMERTEFAQNAGMLFAYTEEQPPEAGYWMFRTRIPLEIAYLDADGRIVAIESMEPCTSPYPEWCPSYPPGKPYWYALEVNPGFFNRYGLGVGDQIPVR